MARILPLIAFGLLSVSAASAQKVTIGEHVVKLVESPHPYAASAAGSPVWSATISHPGAVYIAPFLERLELAEGDVLVVRSPDGSQKWHYERFGRRDLGRKEGFFATHIRGDAAVLELYAATGGAWGVRVSHYGRGFNDTEIELMWQRGLGEKMNLPYPRSLRESVCGPEDTREAKCYQASEPIAYERSRAVARLTLNGSAHCTGWLIGSAGHLMTNEHCIGSQSELNNIDFELMAEGASCATNCATSLGCPGTIEASGGTLVAVNAPLDYALVIPDTSNAGGTNLPATYGFLQLRPTGAVVGERLYIPQHPAGWGKRLAMESTHPRDGGSTGNPAPTIVWSISGPACSGGAMDTEYYADTQGGSSGSPVLGYSDHKVISLHHCRGNAACSSTAGDGNRGVPIESVIASLGANVPPGAVCDAPAVATGVVAVANGDNRIDLSWNAATGADLYDIYRAFGACPQSNWELVGQGVAGTFWSDTTVSGGTTYAYHVVSIDSVEDCRSLPSACSSADATGTCTRAPSFAGLESAASAGTQSCGVALSWAAGSGHCGSQVRYNIYRNGGVVESCVTGTTWVDAVPSAGPWTYVVRAEDDSGNGAGSCDDGNEDTNTVEHVATAHGPDQVVMEDDMESGTAGWVAEAGPNNVPGTAPWGQVTTSSSSPTHAWFVSDQPSVKDQVLRRDTSMAVTSGSILEFWHRFDTEATYDGGVLEISTNGTTWSDIGESRFLQGGYNSTLSTGFSNPLPGRRAWSGSSGGWGRVQVDLSDFAGQSVWLRWRLGCDSSVSGQGWWVDDVRLFAQTPCGDPIFADGFESGDLTAWTTSVP